MMANSDFIAVMMTARENSLARTRILIADDHKQMREHVVRQLEPEFEVVGAVANGEALLAAAPKMQPDVCILDISMPVTSGIEAAAQLQSSLSDSRIVFLTVHKEPDFVEAALNTGALGYVLKSRMGADLIPAIHSALRGKLFVSPGCDFPEP
jgi:DNA-binding NarL/FixJ family response regulator